VKRRVGAGFVLVFASAADVDDADEVEEGMPREAAAEGERRAERRFLASEVFVLINITVTNS